MNEKELQQRRHDSNDAIGEKKQKKYEKNQAPMMEKILIAWVMIFNVTIENPFTMGQSSFCPISSS